MRIDNGCDQWKKLKDRWKTFHSDAVDEIMDS